MINNSHISLSSNNSPRLTARNIIEYTLLLNYQIPDINASSPDFISSIMESTDLHCKALFSSDDTTSFSRSEYNFFGSNIQYDPHLLTYLNFYPIPQEKKDLPHDISISKLLVQNSLLVAYHSILTEYLATCYVPSYQIKNLNGAGAYAAMKKGAVCIKENSVIFNKSKNSDEKMKGNTKSRKSSDFNKAIDKKIQTEELKEQISFTLQKKSSPSSTYSYGLQYASLCTNIKEASIYKMKHIFTGKYKNNCTFLDSLSSLIDDFTPSFNSPLANASEQFHKIGKNAVDGIYQYYLAEKAYGFNLFFSLIKEIYRVSNETTHSLLEDETLTSLAECKKLPNPFSRIYFLRFAFDHLNKATSSNIDFWYFHDIDRRNDVVTRDLRPKGFHISRWFEQYKLFVNYLSDYVIPIYDWYFLCIFLEGIENTYPDKTHLEHLQIALNLLSQYLTNNFQKIMQPLKLSWENTNTLQLADFFSDNKLKHLRKSFFEDNSIELNISPLSLDTFKETKKGASNIKNLHDFYISTLINSH